MTLHILHVQIIQDKNNPKHEEKNRPFDPRRGGGKSIWFQWCKLQTQLWWICWPKGFWVNLILLILEAGHWSRLNPLTDREVGEIYQNLAGNQDSPVVPAKWWGYLHHPTSNLSAVCGFSCQEFPTVRPGNSMKETGAKRPHRCWSIGKKLVSSEWV